MIETAFHEIGIYGASDWMVTVRMLEGLEQLMKAAKRKPDRAAIREQAERLYHHAQRTKQVPFDEERLKNLLDRMSRTRGEENSFEE